jgi:hypothetical protein
MAAIETEAEAAVHAALARPGAEPSRGMRVMLDPGTWQGRDWQQNTDALLISKELLQEGLAGDEADVARAKAALLQALHAAAAAPAGAADAAADTAKRAYFAALCQLHNERETFRMLCLAIEARRLDGLHAAGVSVVRFAPFRPNDAAVVQACCAVLLRLCCGGRDVQQLVVEGGAIEALVEAARRHAASDAAVGGVFTSLPRRRMRPWRRCWQRRRRSARRGS